MAAWLSNCYWWARWHQWFHGGAIISVASSHGWWRHHFWSPDLLTFYEYVPMSPLWVDLADKHVLPTPPWFFRGHVRVRDKAVVERWIRGLK